MFEHAISYLYQHAYVSAVHFAIALTYYGLLRVSDWSTAGLEIRTYHRDYLIFFANLYQSLILLDNNRS